MMPSKLPITNVRYNGDHDVLHIYFAQGAVAWDDEDYPGVVVRRAVDDDHIVGATVLNYSAKRLAVLSLLPFVCWDEVQRLLSSPRAD